MQSESLPYIYLFALYDFRARTYDPETGRFLSRDPLGYTDSMNLYCFVNNNPVCYRDPSGKFLNFVVGAVIGAGVDIFVQTVIEGKSFDEIDWVQVGISTAAGALTSGVSSAAGGAAAGLVKSVAAKAVIKTATTLAVSAAVGTAEEGVNALRKGEEFSVGDAAVSFGRNFAVAGITHGLTKALGKIGSRITRRYLSKDPAKITNRLMKWTNKALGKIDRSERRLVSNLRGGHKRLYYNPCMRSAMRGKAIENYGRDLIKNDAALKGLVRLGNVNRGPDILSEVSGDWWDWTTRKAWPGHLRRGYEGVGHLLDTTLGG